MCCSSQQIKECFFTNIVAPHAAGVWVWKSAGKSFVLKPGEPQPASPGDRVTSIGHSSSGYSVFLMKTKEYILKDLEHQTAVLWHTLNTARAFCFSVWFMCTLLSCSYNKRRLPLLWTLTKDTKWTWKAQSHSSACTDGDSSQGEDTLEVIRIEESHQLLWNTFHKALSKGQGTGHKERLKNMDLLTVMLAIAIPTIPTKCRWVSITFWISTRQFC